MSIARYLLSDFVEIQRKSFFELLENGLIEEFSKRNPIRNSKKNLEVFFYPEYYKLTLPQFSPKNAILNAKSYTSKLYIPVQLTDKVSKSIKLKWVCIGNLPLMTKRGHFILNGAPRVIVNQILRSPGIYYQEKIHENFKTIWSSESETSYKRYYADLICQRGTWLRLEIDKDKSLWAQMKKGPKIPIFWFLIAMGLTEKIIFQTISEPKRLLKNITDEETNEIKKLAEITDDFKKNKKKKKKKINSKIIYKYVKSPPEAWKELYELITNPPSKKKTKEDNTSPVVTSLKEKETSYEDSSTEIKPNKRKKNKKKISKNPWGISQKIFLKLKNEVTADNKRIKLGKSSNKKNLSIFSKLSAFGMQERVNQADMDKEPKSLRTLSAFKLSELGRKWLFNKFMNAKTYDLGKLGRFNFNKKLGISISPNQCTLTPQDLLYATNYLLKVEKGLKKIDDIDHLKNRRVRTSGELLQIQIATGLVRLEKAIKEKLNYQPFPTRFASFKNKNNSLLPKKPAFSSSFKVKSKEESNPQANFSANMEPAPSVKATLSQIVASPKSSIKASIADLNLKKQGVNLKDSSNINSLKTDLFSKPTDFFFKQPTNVNTFETFKTKSPREYKISDLINTKAFNGALREFFGSSPLSQFMDQINPLSELTHKRRLSSMGPGGVTRDTATLAIRGIHPTHYGRICPVETPEGKNTGLVNSLTAFARVNPQGFLLSPFYKVYKGQVQKQAGMFYLSAEQEEKTKLASADISISPAGFLPNSTIPVRITDEFTKISRDLVEYVGVSPIQMISIATSLIPFLEHDDANRALMGSNMQRQAVPLIRPERPIVGTGLEARVVSDSGHAIQAKYSGFVRYASANKVVVYSFCY
uniref:DNA-directed RNA polymerase n=1 Tax=Lobochlamys culleus TaxID=51693 RepID=A0A0S2ICD7_9CHLO|nr:beta subunit of RNA polymerase [Lobochlamys culleus]